MKRAVSVLVIAFALLIGMSGTANADLGQYLNNPGFNQSQSVSCNSGHGAFQFFEGQRAAWIPAAAQAGGIGDTTGPTQSGFAQYCKTQ